MTFGKQSELTWEARREVDLLCDRFERQLRTRGDAQIESYLAEAAAPLRNCLLSDLLAVELEYASEMNLHPDRGRYLRRFPANGHIVEDAFDRAMAALPPFRIGSERPTALAVEQETSVASKPSQVAPSRGLSAALSKQYELLHELGHGGMGVVYLARQRDADRLVALKVVRSDRFGSGEQHQAVMRFRQEARIAAQVVHPNVVTIFDVGVSDGCPYYSMEYVSGRSLADALANGPVLPERASRWISASARGLDAAHAMGVLHRDVKPRNILLNTDDEPLVSDFGMAKWLGIDEGLTETGVGLGTPAYMSPEQALDASHVGPLSDLYGLGATLYEALTGRPPFQAADALTTLRQVIEDEPVSPRELNAAVPVDLDTICLKCLEKDPHRRFGSVSELADDLDRFLAGQPIQARPIGSWERGWRWCNRHRLVTALLAGFLLSVVVGLAGVGWQWRRAVANELVAQQNLSLARGVVADYLDTVAEEQLLDEPGMQPLREHLLRSALDYYLEFARQAPDTVESRSDLADAWSRVGRIHLALESHADALDALSQACALNKALATADPQNALRQVSLARATGNLALLHRKMGNLDQALEQYELAIAVQRRAISLEPQQPENSIALGALLVTRAATEIRLGELARAEQTCLTAQSILEPLSRDDLDNVDGQLVLANCYDNLGIVHMRTYAPELSLDWHQRAVEIRESLVARNSTSLAHIEKLADSYANVAATHQAQGEYGLASHWQGKAFKQREALARRNPAVPRYRRERARSQTMLAELAMATGDFVGAEEFSEDATRWLQQAVNDYPDAIDMKVHLARGWHATGMARLASGDHEAAVPILRDALELGREVSALTSGHDSIQSQVLYMGTLAAAVEDIDRKEAAELRRRALSLQRELVVSPESGESLNLLAERLLQLGNLQAKLGKKEASRGTLAQAVELWKQLSGQYPTVPSLVLRLGGARSNIAKQLRAEGRLEDALAMYDAAIEPLLTVQAHELGNRRVALALRNAYWGRALVLNALGRHEAALLDWDAAIALGVDQYGESLLVRRAWTLAVVGDAESALAEVDAIRSMGDLQPRTLFNLACILSLCAASTDVAADQNRALDYLEQAEQAGYFRDATKRALLEGTDLDAIRDEERFRALHERLRSSTSPS